MHERCCSSNMAGHDKVDRVYAERNMQQVTYTFRMNRAEFFRVCLHIMEQPSLQPTATIRHNIIIADSQGQQTASRQTFEEKNKTKKVRERKK